MNRPRAIIAICIAWGWACGCFLPPVWLAFAIGLPLGVAIALLARRSVGHWNPAAAAAAACTHPAEARFTSVDGTLCVRCGVLSPGEDGQRPAATSRLNDLLVATWETQRGQRRLTDQEAARSAALRKALQAALAEIVAHNVNASHTTSQDAVMEWSRLTGDDVPDPLPRQASGLPS